MSGAGAVRPAGPDQDVAGRLREVLGPDVEVRASVDHGVPTVDVPPSAWVAALAAARDRLGFTYFDWLSAVDEQEAGIDVVVHLWAPGRRSHLQVRARVRPPAPELPSAAEVFAGAGWHERETAEMFGVVFTGHPRPAPLLLPEGFEGHPLRKDFVLASRVAKAWPGGKEPGGESRRRPPPAPGVPEPGSWGAPGEAGA